MTVTASGLAGVPLAIEPLTKRDYTSDQEVRWCPGCGDYAVLAAFQSLMPQLGIKRENTVIVSGIGCPSRASGYMNFNTIHTAHGRALPFATGIKLANPELNVIVITGDGDSTAIGGNHLIHAARRNIDLTVILVNNNIYGMTGGQCSPTTPHEAIATTAPYGNIEPDFNICELALGAGASYVARTTAYHTQETQNIVKEAIEHPGFALIEVVSACPVIYGRLNKKGGAPEMMKEMRDNSIPLAAMEKLPPEKVEGKIIRGVLRKDLRPEYTAQYADLVKRVQAMGGDT